MFLWVSKQEALTAALAASGNAALPLPAVDEKEQLSFIASPQSAISQTARTSQARVKPSVKLIQIKSDSPLFNSGEVM